MADNESEQSGPNVTHEIEHGHADYTGTDLLEQSQWNAQALALAVFDAVGDDPARLNAMVERIAGVFAQAWDIDRDWRPVEALDALLTNLRSFGGKVETYEPDGNSPRAVVTGLPDLGLSEQLGVSPRRFRPMLVISQRLVEALGCELEWSHDAPAGRIRLQVGKTA